MAQAPGAPSSEGCRHAGCARTRWARGLCRLHYQSEYRTRGGACKRKGCRATAFATGLCVRHYQERYRTNGPPCTRRDCEAPAFSRGLCVRHYHRWYQRTLAAHGVQRLRDVPAGAGSRRGPASRRRERL